MRSNKFFSLLRVILFALVVILGCVVGFIIPMRPTVSDAEGRVLTEFPEFTLESFLSGEYTSKLNLWYSDTFPARDALMDGNTSLKVLYGIKTVDFGGKSDKDEINLDETFVWEDFVAESDNEIYTDPEDSEDVFLEQDTQSEPGGDTVTETVVDTEEEQPSATESKTESAETETEPLEKEVIDGYYVIGDTAHQLFYFDRALVDRYTRSVVQAAIDLDGIAQVYDIIVPTSTCFYLSDSEIERLGASDGNDAITYMYKAINAYSEQLVEQGQLKNSVKTLDVRSCLKLHKDEYLFFRTDHHWTGLGAYYTSRFFLDAVGKAYPSLDEYKTHRIDGFLGTLYRHTQNANLKNNPDTVYAYESPTVKKVTVYDDNNDTYVEDLLINTSVTSSNKYLCFSSGDRPYYEIHNESIHDGSAILMIKESYGNAFLPMIADSYEYVYAIDYRFWDGDLVGLVTEKNIDTVLFLNNLTATVTNYNIWTMERCIK